MKKCSSCLKNKNFDCFYNNRRTPDGYAYLCKSCLSTYSKQYKKQNKEKIALKKRNWYENNKEHALNYAATYYAHNKEKVINKVIEYRRKRLHSDPEFKLRKNLRHRLGKLLKQGTSKVAINFLGCSVNELKSYLEDKWQPGMTWDNYGIKGWHVDHIIPLCQFDLTKEEELKKACHYTNLQPLWWQDNLRKNGRID